jgi:dynein light chain roadblock-type
MSEGESSTSAPLANGRESLSPAPTSAVVPPEIESTLSRLSAYRAVKGVMILSRSPVVSTESGGAGGIVQCTGSIFEGEGGGRYARLVEGLVSGATKGVGECDEGVSLLSPYLDLHTGIKIDGQDELRLMRIRTKRHELIITPGKLDYLT